MFNIQCLVFSVPYTVFSVECSVFSVRCSVSSVECCYLIRMPQIKLGALVCYGRMRDRGTVRYIAVALFGRNMSDSLTGSSIMASTIASTNHRINRPLHASTIVRKYRRPISSESRLCFLNTVQFCSMFNSFVQCCSIF